MEHKLKKNILEYKAVVWDLDGTLYFQRKLRILMGFKLALYYLCHLFSIKELLILKKFREIRDEWDIYEDKNEADSELSISDRQYSFVAGIMNTDTDTVKCIIERWIYVEPLESLKRCRDDEAFALMNRVKLSGNDNYIFSDYPIEDKLASLDMQSDGNYSSVDERLKVMKPDPKGLLLIMQDHGIDASEVVVIGDRFDKDGQAAINAGCDYIILGRSSRERTEFYSSTRDMSIY